MQRLGIPGEDSKGVMNALELISAYKAGHIREIHGTIVVVGAGNTAIDAANAARRLGAEAVYLLYRRGRSDMSAFDFEYDHAKQEGVQFLWRRQPLAIQPAITGACCLTRCWFSRWTELCPFRIRTSPSNATWWSPQLASHRFPTCSRFAP